MASSSPRVDLYESAVASAFVYRFGYLDALGKHGGGHLMLTAQSPLDALLGDLVGELRNDRKERSRYFLVEFKQHLTGDSHHSFDSELAKPLRRALLKELLNAQLAPGAVVELIADFSRSVSASGVLQDALALSSDELLVYLAKLSKSLIDPAKKAQALLRLQKRRAAMSSRFAAGVTRKGQRRIAKEAALLGKALAAAKLDSILAARPHVDNLIAEIGKPHVDMTTFLGGFGSDCWPLSQLGHFGVWREANKLRTAPYVNAVMGWPGSGANWGTLRQLWWELRRSSPVHGGGLWFTDGLGLTAGGMKRYLRCIFAMHGPVGASDAATLVALGCLPPAGRPPKIAIGRFSSLAKAFLAMRLVKDE